jgi:3-oxoacyl-[acyl-carrier protein] reductase
MKQYFKFKLKMINLNSKWVYLILTLLSIAPAYSQNEASPCELDGKIFYNDCIQYKGDCEHSQANGWGHLYLNNGNVITAFFKDNKIQNYHMHFYDAKSKYDYFVPNKGSSFAGPYVSIDKSNFVSFNENGFQIAEPNFLSNRVFSDPYMKANDGLHLIPNTNNIIYISAREYNAKGNYKYWLSVMDLSSNKVIRTFGSNEKPLSLDIAPEFIGFEKDNMPVFKISSKYYLYNISTGVSTAQLSLPIGLPTQNTADDAKKKTTYKDYSGRDKWIALADSSYLKVFNYSKTKIIVFSSIAGIKVTKAPITYSVAKAALNFYTKYKAKQLSPYKINLNVISPGNIIMKNNNWGKKLINNKKNVLNYIRQNVPLNTFCYPEEIFNLCKYLSIENTSAITGSNFIIDGGETL